MTAAAVDCGVDTDALLGDYLDYVASLGLGERAVRDRTRIAREFLSRNPNLPAWMALPAAQRAAELRSSQAWPLVCYAIGTDRIRLDVELAAVKQLTGLGRQPSWQARHLASSPASGGCPARHRVCVKRPWVTIAITISERDWRP
jgi:hypothetical protein